jgi:hypothetical protein
MFYGCLVPNINSIIYYYNLHCCSVLQPRFARIVSNRRIGWPSVILEWPRHPYSNIPMYRTETGATKVPYMYMHSISYNPLRHLTLAARHLTWQSSEVLWACSGRLRIVNWVQVGQVQHSEFVKLTNRVYARGDCGKFCGTLFALVSCSLHRSTCILDNQNKCEESRRRGTSEQKIMRTQLKLWTGRVQKS